MGQGNATTDPTLERYEFLALQFLENLGEISDRNFGLLGDNGSLLRCAFMEGEMSHCTQSVLDGL
jgi:hypothetical protein